MKNKIGIAYSLSGYSDRETLLFIHGTGANLIQFEKQHYFFKEQYQVLSLSLRGHGETTLEYALDSSDFKLSKMAQDILDLLDSLHIDKVHYIGNSMGGNIGFELLKLDESRLLSLTTFGTVLELKKSELFVWIMSITYRLLPQTIIAKMAQYSGVSDYAKRKINKMFLKSSKTTLLKLLPHLAKFSYLKTIQESRIPLFIIRGREDTEVNCLLDINFLDTEIQEKFHTYEIEDAGHFANFDNPHKFNLIVQRIIESV